MTPYMWSWIVVTVIVVIMNILYTMAAFNEPKKYAFYTIHAIILTSLHIAASAIMIYELLASGRWCL